MALELLYEGYVTQNGVNCKATQKPAWVDGLGYVGPWSTELSSSSFQYAACQLDGELVRIAGFANYTFAYLQDYAKSGLIANYYGGLKWYEIDPATQIYDQTPIYTYNDPPGGMNTYVVRLPDRYLKAYGTSGNSAVQWAPLDGSAGWTDECVFTPENNPNPDWYHWASYHISAAGGGLYWLCGHKGGFALYDAQNHVVLESYKVAPIPSGYYELVTEYSQDLGVFISLYRESPGNRNLIRVWATETRPYSLSDPIALSTLQRGSATTMEVQLLGEHNDPVRDFPVDWTLTSGTGQLSADQTFTDDNGKAQVDYIPDNLASSGFTLQAEAQY